ncbi:hypothetical protein LSUE1_G001607 [Lachnellula suecica]|uniref:Uncharacterized protein n=1 Tax=Lachnellula suecica TaxID=602035 RepID=A0A8T9CAX1_9HELO|nr:hypothetical protein LSUE1_G001607 [Lachnellula suecica]
MKTSRSERGHEVDSRESGYETLGYNKDDSPIYKNPDPWVNSDNADYDDYFDDDSHVSGGVTRGAGVMR